MDELLRVMMDAAHGAGRMMLEAGREQIGFKTKSSFRDLVTKYDVLVQTYVVGQLCAAFPEARFISEEGDGLQTGAEILGKAEADRESGADTESGLEAELVAKTEVDRESGADAEAGTGDEIVARAEADKELAAGAGDAEARGRQATAEAAGVLVFVIDPIDGTANFSHHYQHSCISIGCMCDGIPTAGVVYDPFLNEMFSAVRGKGAYLNGEKLVIPQHSLSESLVLFGSSPYYMELADKTFQHVRAVFGRCQDIRRTGSAALDLCYVAAGRAGLYFECMLSVWDYAAGALIVKEAGGICQTMEGEELIFDRPAKSSVIAGNAGIIEESGLVAAQ